MKHFQKFALFLLPLSAAGAGCQGQTSSQPTTSSSSVSVPAAETIAWIKPTFLRIQGDCKALYKNDRRLVSVNINDDLRVDLVPVTKDLSSASPVFFKDGKRLSIPAYPVSTFCRENSDWFGLGVVYLAGNRLDQDRIYLTMSGGHEAFPSYARYDGKAWHAMDPWMMVKDVFPDRVPAPFRLDVASGHMRLVELGGNFGGRTYTESDEKRVATRMVYALDPETLRILETATVQRNSDE